MSRISNFYLTLVTSAVMASASAANDNSLYAEPAPKDASFVRFLGYKDAAKATFFGKNFSLTDEDKGAFIPVSSSLLKNVEVGSYFTVFADELGGQIVVSEGPRDTRAKVFLFLVNASGKALDLRLADNSATVISAVEHGNSGQRGVNPLAVKLGVFAPGSDQPLATFDVSLQRGQNISFVADATGVRLIENRFGAVAK